MSTRCNIALPPLSRWVFVLAGLAAGRALVAWFWLEAELRPDTRLYVSDGLGLFPSPLGRVLGSWGLDVLAVYNAAACAALVVLAALLAQHYGGRPFLAGLIALCIPVAFWTVFVGMDALGAALLLGAVLCRAKRKTFDEGFLLFAAVAVHLAVAPLVLAAALTNRRLWVPGAAVAVLVASAALLTPYGGNATGLLQPSRVFAVGTLTLLLALMPFGPWLVRLFRAHELRSLLVAWAVATGLAAGVVGAEAKSSNTRYALPLVLLAAVIVATPSGSRWNI